MIGRSGSRIGSVCRASQSARTVALPSKPGGPCAPNKLPAPTTPIAVRNSRRSIASPRSNSNGSDPMRVEHRGADSSSEALIFVPETAFLAPYRVANLRLQPGPSWFAGRSTTNFLLPIDRWCNRYHEMNEWRSVTIEIKRPPAVQAGDHTIPGHQGLCAPVYPRFKCETCKQSSAKKADHQTVRLINMLSEPLVPV